MGGTGTASPNAATTVFAYLSTPPQLRRRSRLLWRQGPCNLFEDIISTATVQILYQLGPNYIGSFQAPILGNPSQCMIVLLKLAEHSWVQKVYTDVNLSLTSKKIFALKVNLQIQNGNMYHLSVLMGRAWDYLSMTIIIILYI